MQSPEALKTLAWNCRSLARHTDAVELKSSLFKMAEKYERHAVLREQRFAGGPDELEPR